MRLRFILVSFFLLLAFDVASANKKMSHEKRTITIENLAFTPAEIEIHRGETITWINKDSVPHSVTGSNNIFESGSISPNAKWSYRIKSSEDIVYRCSFHPAMTGKIKIIK